MEDASAELLARYQAGDERAADELFYKYLERLTALARTRLSSKLASRADPEDIVMSAYRSFFIGARNGRFALQRSGDLWRLLVAIVMHKLYHQVQHHTADMRSVEREARPDPSRSRDYVALARDPTPEEALLLADELEHALAQLAPPERRVLELRLQGAQIAEIAHELQRSERTVRRILEGIRETLSQSAEIHGPAPAT